jgi:hypothetical protein
MSLACSQYLVAERDAYFEYGLVPTDMMTNSGTCWYAMVVAGLVAFLHFTKDVATRLTPTRGIHVGVCLRGTEGKRICGLFEGEERLDPYTVPPVQDGFLFEKTVGNSSAWAVDEVAREAATELLVHWSYRGAMRSDPPEFENGVYKGECFRSRFSQVWFSRC